MIITDLEITAAQDQADAAARELAAAEQNLGDGSVNDETAGRLAVLAARARQSQRKVDDLRSRQASQRDQLAARAAVETSHTATLDRAAAQLSASRVRLADAITRAQSALLSAFDAAAEHDALVDFHRAELVAAGLGLEDVAPDADHLTGAATGMSRAMRLRGQSWYPISPAAVLGWIARQVARATGDQITLARLATLPGVTAMDRRVDGLLDGVAPPEPVNRQRSRVQIEPVRLARPIPDDAA